MRYACVAGMIVATLTGTAVADVYKCPDGTGKLLYQNTPCHESAVPVLTPPTQSTPPPALPMHSLEAPAAGSATAPTAADPVASPPKTSPPESRVVDTRQLSAIELGMGKAEVARRLGPPERVDTSEYDVRIGYAQKVRVQEERWTYPGTSSVPPAIIIFKNGEVDSRGREGEEKRRSVSDLLHRR